MINFRMLALSIAAYGMSAIGFTQGHIIVGLAKGHIAADLPKTFPVSVLDTTSGAPFALLKVLPGKSVLAVQQAMRLRPDLVTFAEDDDSLDAPENIGAGKGGTVAAVFEPTAAYKENKNLFAQINFQANLPTFTNYNRVVKVGILDTGISSKSPFLTTRTIAYANFATDRKDVYDAPTGVDSNHNGIINEGIGHGSMVAGLIAQMAPSAKLVVARIADADGVSTAWQMIHGVVFCCQKGAEVINISFGSSHRVTALSDVISDWVEPQGVLVVAPIGNNSSAGALAPSSISKIVCVAGLDSRDQKAGFSNWDGKAIQCSPCTGIKSVWWNGAMGVWSGTSFASPLVTGTICNGLRFRASRLNLTQMGNFRKLISQIGVNVDSLNVPYKKRLGLKLDYFNLCKSISKF